MYCFCRISARNMPRVGGPIQHSVKSRIVRRMRCWTRQTSEKRRLSGSKTEVTAMSAQVKGKSVVLYDDMIRTGSSLLGAARAYLDAGATKVAAIATHGIFPGDALDVLLASGAFSAIACTDSHPRARELSGKGLIVESVAGVLADALGLGTSS